MPHGHPVVVEHTNAALGQLYKATKTFKHIKGRGRFLSALQEIALHLNCTYSSKREDFWNFLEVLFRDNNTDESPFIYACRNEKVDLIQYYLSLYVINRKRYHYEDSISNYSYAQWISAIGPIGSLSLNTFMDLRKQKETSEKVRNILKKKVSMNSALSYVQSFLIYNGKYQRLNWFLINRLETRAYTCNEYRIPTTGPYSLCYDDEEEKFASNTNNKGQKKKKKQQRPILNCADDSLVDTDLLEEVHYAEDYYHYDDDTSSWSQKDDEITNNSRSEHDDDVNEGKEEEFHHASDSDVDKHELKQELKEDDDILSYKWVCDDEDEKLSDCESLLLSSDNDDDASSWAITSKGSSMLRIDEAAGRFVEDHNSTTVEEDWDEVSDMQSVISVNTFASGKPNFSYKDALSLNKKGKTQQVVASRNLIKAANDYETKAASKAMIPIVEDLDEEEEDSRTLLFHDPYFDHDFAKQKGGQRRTKNRLKGN